jgi:hypothetical protein
MPMFVQRRRKVALSDGNELIQDSLSQRQKVAKAFRINSSENDRFFGESALNTLFCLCFGESAA